MQQNVGYEVTHNKLESDEMATMKSDHHTYINLPCIR